MICSILLSISLIGCYSDCGGHEQAVALARHLSQERLQRIYQESRDAFSKTQYAYHTKYDKTDSIPKQWLDLRPISVTSYGELVRIHLAGCFDDKTVLYVESIDDPSNGKISLMPGEWQPIEILWEAKHMNKNARRSGRHCSESL
jgi:hypothetical protein